LKDLVKKIVIGSWSFSGDLGKANIKNSHEAIAHAIKNNLNQFDTAPVYGDGIVDNLLSNYKKEIIVNTKCGYGEDSSKKTFNEDDIKRSLDKSLNTFEKINILYLHNPRNEIKKWGRIIHLLNQFKKEKLIKFIGISLARDYYFDKDLLSEFDFIQDDINLLKLNNLSYLKKTKKKIVARSPLATGLITNKFNFKTKFSKKDYRYGWCKNERFKSILFQVDQLKKLYGKNKEVAEFAQLYLLQNKHIDLINFGVKNLDQVNCLINLVKKKKINESIIKKLSLLIRKNYNLESTAEVY